MKIIHIAMAGGRAERLRPLTWLVPKPLLPLRGGVRLVDFWINGVIAHRENAEVVPVAMVGYKASLVQRYLQQQLPEIVILAAENMGSGGGLHLHWDRLAGMGIDIAVVSPSDHYHSINYAKLVAQHIETYAEITLVTITSREQRHQYVVRDGQGARLVSHATRLNSDAYAGIAVVSLHSIEPNVKASLPPFDFTDAIIRSAAASLKVSTYHESAPWEDLGTWPRYLSYLRKKRKESR